MDLISIAKVESVTLEEGYITSFPKGTLCLSPDHFLFVYDGIKKQLMVYNSLIQDVKKLPVRASGSPISVECKNFVWLNFVIPRDKDCYSVYETLLRLSKPENINDLPCINSVVHYKFAMTEGWVLDLSQEYSTMPLASSQWQRSDINCNYELCDTYPSVLWFPSPSRNPIDSKVIRASAQFRSKSRLPALTYLHGNQAALVRSSQPFTGLNNRCFEDERLFEAIQQVNPSGFNLHIVDTRPQRNAIANRAQGKGYENGKDYKNIVFQFFDIQNIHVMRGSLEKLLKSAKQLRAQNVSKFTSGIKSSGWLQHLKLILETAGYVTKQLQSGSSVLVHCSDGWDRTAQVCALAQIMINARYRTIEGFKWLIEKDWLAFGHKFVDRCRLLNCYNGNNSFDNDTNNSSSTIDKSEQSPVFLQFLDCVHQLQIQYPCAFEFNDSLLRFLYEAVCSSQYGTFVGNCERERRLIYELYKKTYSVWGYVEYNRKKYVNAVYCADRYVDAKLYPNSNPQVYRLWTEMYNAGDMLNEAGDTLLLSNATSIMEENKNLKSRLALLKSHFIPDLSKVTNTPIADDDVTYKWVDIKALLNVDWCPAHSVNACVVCSSAFITVEHKHQCCLCGKVLCEHCFNLKCNSCIASNHSSNFNYVKLMPFKNGST